MFIENNRLPSYTPRIFC